MLNPTEESSQPDGLEESQTHDAASHRIGSPEHNQLDCFGLCGDSK